MAIETETGAEKTRFAPPAARDVRPLLFYVIAALVFLTDQASKAWVQRVMAWEQSRPILGDFFSLTLTRNTGGAWGLLPNRNFVFIIFAAVAVVALVYAYHRMHQVPLLVASALSLALGGALGNLLDRLRYQYVVDFFHLHAGRFHWPIFNVADTAISLGIILLMIHFFRASGSETGEAANRAAETKA